MSLKLYYDLLSQPSRAVFIFLKANNISFEPIPVAIRKGEQLTNQYKQINRFGTVPCIDDNGFKLMESGAILRYLIRENSVPDHWFPKDSKKQARVDQYISWAHHNTRFLCNFYFQRKYLMPLRLGKPTKPELVEESKDRMLGCIEKIQEIFMEDRNYIAGDELTIADLLAACELEQTRIAGYDPRSDFPKIASWLERVRSELNPHYDEAHALVDKLIELNKGKNLNCYFELL